jgi:hypothetical protein
MNDSSHSLWYSLGSNLYQKFTKNQNQNTLFSLSMLTYGHQDIIQIALKRLPGGINK